MGGFSEEQLQELSQIIDEQRANLIIPPWWYTEPMDQFDTDDDTDIEVRFRVMAMHLTSLSKAIHVWATHKGFRTQKANLLAKLMLAVCELSEAAEEARGGNWEGFGTEIADVIIRCLDISAAMNIDITDKLAKKMAQNYGRPYRHGKTNSEE